MLGGKYAVTGFGKNVEESFKLYLDRDILLLIFHTKLLSND